MSTLAVYDCMLFFRAAARPERVQPLFALVERQEVTLCLSSDVLSEIRDVLTRPKLLAKYPALTTLAVDAYLAQKLRSARFFDHVPDHFQLKRDPKDSKDLNLAITAGAPYLVTFDRDLLDLMQPDSVEGIEFRNRYPTVHVLDATSFERAIRG